MHVGVKVFLSFGGFLLKMKEKGGNWIGYGNIGA